MPSNSNIESLIRLLDDPDDEVFTAICKELYSHGVSVIKKLEETWEHSTNKLVQKRIEDITQYIHFEDISKNLSSWLKSDEHNLLDALLWVSKYQYPDISFDKYKKQFEDIIQDIKSELTDNLTPLETIRVINHILFQVHSFSRSFTGYNSPQNYYISNLFDSKKGNFLSLCMLYMAVCQEVGLPIHGLELPDNMVLAYTNANTEDPQELKKQEVLFYINPSNKGAIFSKLEIDSFLGKIHVEKNEIFYTPVFNKNMLLAMLKSLMQSYERLGYKNKRQEIEQLLRNIAPDVL